MNGAVLELQENVLRLRRGWLDYASFSEDHFPVFSFFLVVPDHQESIDTAGCLVETSDEQEDVGDTIKQDTRFQIVDETLPGKVDQALIVGSKAGGTGVGCNDKSDGESKSRDKEEGWEQPQG